LFFHFSGRVPQSVTTRRDVSIFLPAAGRCRSAAKKNFRLHTTQPLVKKTRRHSWTGVIPNAISLNGNSDIILQKFVFRIILLFSYNLSTI